MDRTLDLIMQELEAYPQITATIEPGKRHPRVRLVLGDQSRFIVYSSTPVDRRGMLNKRAELRRLIADMVEQAASSAANRSKTQ